MIATLIQVAKEMARYEEKKHSWKQERVILHRLCESAIKGKGDPKVAVVDVTNQVARLEDYKDDERYKYLYALSTGKHAIGPSWLLDFSKKKGRDEIIRTGIREIRGSLASLSELMLNSEMSDFAKAFKEWEDLDKKLIETTKNETVILMTVQWKGKFPGEWDELCKSFINKKVVGERRARKGMSRCAVCSSEGQVSSAIPFRFFTVEKLGFSPMGHEEQVWKYAPLCEKCAKWLYVAESYLQENLSTRVAGKPTYLVPDLEPDAAEIEGSFVHFLWEWRERTKDKIVPQEEFPIRNKGNKAKPKSAGDSESGGIDSFPNLFEGLVEESEERFKDRPPFRSASLIFYQPGQKFMFLYTISEILPRNLKKAKLRLESLRKLLRDGVLGDGGSQLARGLKANFEFVGRAWKWPRRGQTGSQGELRLTPMHLVEAILMEQRPHEREFWQDADSLFRAIYQEVMSSKDQKRTVQNALTERVRLIWAIWALVYRSTELEGGINMEMSTTTQPAKSGVTPEFWEKFFEPRLLLDSPAKRAVFLIGALFGRVESKQRTERESKQGEMPIISRLRGLAVSGQEIMEKLFPELMLKLRQLDANTQAIQMIQQAAADFASKGGELSDEEARFCFCLGWALSWTTVNAVGEVLGARKSEGTEEAYLEEETEDES